MKCGGKEKSQLGRAGELVEREGGSSRNMILSWRGAAVEFVNRINVDFAVVALV